MPIPVAPLILALDPAVRYVAANRDGAIAEMAQRAESHNPPETDRMEELVVNPVILEAARRRGDLDLDGVRFVVIRYGKQYQAVFPIRGGHVSVGIEAGADAVAIAERVEETLRAEALRGAGVRPAGCAWA